MYKSDSLTHYGVLGMRWGRRKTTSSFEKKPRREKAKDTDKKAKNFLVSVKEMA